MTLKEKYNKYLEYHQNENNRELHYIGNVVTFIFVVWMIVLGAYWWLLLAPFIIYPFAWTGHLVFEKNKPVAFKTPVTSKLCDWIMCYRMQFNKPMKWE